MSTKKKSKSVSKDENEENTKYIDLLDEDKPISGQKYACLSFISPEDHIKNKNLFYFEKFLKNFEFKKTFEKYTQFLNFIAYKYNVDFDKLTKDMEEFVEEEKSNLFLTTLDDEYKSYIDAKEEDLQKEYNQSHEFQTNTRGIKVRGVFGSQEEAEMRCKMLRQEDHNHDVYVGPVGMWMPFHPEAYKTGRVEYLEKELNDLMAKKKENDDTSKEHFKQRVQEAKKKAIQENIEKASKEGNKLMQSIDEEGNLVNADRMDVPGKNLLFGDGENDDTATADLRKELFESEDVILKSDKDNDHGLSQILERRKQKEERDAKKELEESKEDLEKLAAMADGMESVSEPPNKDPINVD